jgi:hypothetical protein
VIVDGFLAGWNTRSIPDGNYELRLSVSDTLGLDGTARVSVIVDNQEPHAVVTSPARVSAASGGHVYTTGAEVDLYFPPHAFGADAVVTIDPLADAELLVMLSRYLDAVGARETRLELNSVGDATCRPVYRERLREFGKAHLASLCPDCHRRLERNPLRILDCKVEACRRVVAQAPVVFDSLCDACRGHLDAVRALLAQEHVPYEMNPRLVRGLDYYCRTAFEVVGASLFLTGFAASPWQIGVGLTLTGPRFADRRLRALAAAKGSPAERRPGAA